MGKRRRPPAAAPISRARNDKHGRPSDGHWSDGATSAALFLALLMVVLAIYGRSLDAPLVFDDGKAILDNPTITRLWPLIGDQQTPGPLSLPRNLPTGGRP